MNQDNYRLLQVDENASDEEIKSCYERLKEIYNEEKWKDGEEGNNAARMLERLDAAYNEIMEERREKASNTSGASSFEAVSEAIRNGDIARAQQLLELNHVFQVPQKYPPCVSNIWSDQNAPK